MSCYREGNMSKNFKNNISHQVYSGVFSYRDKTKLSACFELYVRYWVNSIPKGKRKNVKNKEYTNKRNMIHVCSAVYVYFYGFDLIITIMINSYLNKIILQSSYI